MKEHIIVMDNDGHRYIIPYERMSEWYWWLDIPSDDERSWDVPDYAIEVDGARVVFTTWRLE